MPTKKPWQVHGGITNAPITVGETVIPAGGTLIVVTDPAGSDKAHLYYMRYTFNGVDILYQIGDRARFLELFPEGVEMFHRVERINGERFVKQDWYEVGAIDEVLGQKESLGALFEREMLELTQGGGLADWVVNSREALALMTVATLEGWTQAQTAEALVGTKAFANRFVGWDGFIAAQKGPGTLDYYTAMTTYLDWEGQIADALRMYRGPDTNISSKYIGRLIGAGWQPGQIAQLLPVEQDLKDNPETLRDLNRILKFMGLDTINLRGFLNITQGNAPLAVQEALSDYNLLLQLQREGLDFGAAQVAEIREGVDPLTGIQAPETFSELARTLATAIVQNRAELDAEKFGLTRDDLLAASLNRIDFISGGRSTADVEYMLTKFMRERQAASQGYDAFSGYLSAQDRLRLQGLSGL